MSDLFSPTKTRKGTRTKQNPEREDADSRDRGAQFCTSLRLHSSSPPRTRHSHRLGITCRAHRLVEPTLPCPRLRGRVPLNALAVLLGRKRRALWKKALLHGPGLHGRLALHGRLDLLGHRAPDVVFTDGRELVLHLTPDRNGSRTRQNRWDEVLHHGHSFLHHGHRPRELQGGAGEITSIETCYGGRVGRGKSGGHARMRCRAVPCACVGARSVGGVGHSITGCLKVGGHGLRHRVRAPGWAADPAAPPRHNGLLLEDTHAAVL